MDRKQKVCTVDWVESGDLVLRFTMAFSVNHLISGPQFLMNREMDQNLKGVHFWQWGSFLFLNEI